MQLIMREKWQKVAIYNQVLLDLLNRQLMLQDMYQDRRNMEDKVVIHSQDSSRTNRIHIIMLEVVEVVKIMVIKEIINLGSEF